MNESNKKSISEMNRDIEVAKRKLSSKITKMARDFLEDEKTGFIEVDEFNFSVGEEIIDEIEGEDEEIQKMFFHEYQRLKAESEEILKNLSQRLKNLKNDDNDLAMDVVDIMQNHSDRQRDPRLYRQSIHLPEGFQADPGIQDEESIPQPIEDEVQD